MLAASTFREIWLIFQSAEGGACTGKLCGNSQPMARSRCDTLPGMQQRLPTSEEDHHQM